MREPGRRLRRRPPNRVRILIAAVGSPPFVLVNRVILDIRSLHTRASFPRSALPQLFEVAVHPVVARVLRTSRIVNEDGEGQSDDFQEISLEEVTEEDGREQGESGAGEEDGEEDFEQ